MRVELGSSHLLFIRDGCECIWKHATAHGLLLWHVISSIMRRCSIAVTLLGSLAAVPIGVMGRSRCMGRDMRRRL